MEALLSAIQSSTTTTLTITDALIDASVASLLGLIISLTYIYTGKTSKNFARTLIIMPSLVCLVNYYGYVSGNYYGDANFATRPVVSIPRSEVNITVTGTGSTATLSLNKVTQQN